MIDVLDGVYADLESACKGLPDVWCIDAVI